MGEGIAAARTPAQPWRALSVRAMRSVSWVGVTDGHLCRPPRQPAPGGPSFVAIVAGAVQRTWRGADLHEVLVSEAPRRRRSSEQRCELLDGFPVVVHEVLGSRVMHALEEALAIRLRVASLAQQRLAERVVTRDEVLIPSVQAR